jgi:tetratricopeptide (TPR) repeat protein
LFAVAGVLATADQCADLRKHGKAQEARACFQRLAASPDPWARAEGLWGLERYQDAHDTFWTAVERQPKNADLKVRLGRLFAERYQPADASKQFKEALEIAPDHAGAMLGLALVSAEHFDKAAVDLAEKALAADPKLVEARELLARLALEDNNPEKAAAEADKAIAMAGDALDAMGVRMTIDLLEDKRDTPWTAKIAAINPAYAEAHAAAARIFVLNRRYEEGIALFRKALELNPRLWPAHSELGINLMRLGENDAARKHLESAYEAGFRNAATANTLTLMDSYKNFETVRSGNVILKLHKKESALLRPYLEAELRRAVATYEKKYKTRLERPVQLEVYPDHEDFAVRTLGMPGLGALGVAFGYVVAMDSPSGRKPGSFHWASTLWHELSHVFVLAATKHRVPRWFTEGMAVHEETAISPDWGDRLDPGALAAIRDKKLLPVTQLDRGFVRPSYPGQVTVSYFQAGRICDYINGKWGYDKLLGMMHAFAARAQTAEVIEKQLGMKPEQFDREFLAWLEGQTGKTVSAFGKWQKTVKQVAADAKAQRWDAVIKEGTAIRDLYPDFVEAGSVYELLANAYLESGDKASATKELEAYARMGGRSPGTLKKLANLLEEQGKKREAAMALNRINYIYIHDEELHRRLGDLYLELGDAAGAIREYGAVIASKPQDGAASHFNLARAYMAANRKDEAKDQIIAALEIAPGFKPAQRMLLELSK